MKEITPALFLYFASGFLFFASIILGFEHLTILFKPIIIPSIFFYYMQKNIGKINLWFFVSLVFFFISNVLNLFEYENSLLHVMIFNLLAYTILLFFTLKVFLKFKLSSFDNINLMFIFIMFVFLSCMLYVALFMIFDTNFEFYLIIILYAFVLLFLGLLSTIISVINHNQGNNYLLTAIFCFIICDLFFALYYYYYDFVFFRYISVLCNVISFYFLINYFLFWNKNVDSNDDI